MNTCFQTVVDGILRLDVPFDNLYTSVFLIEGAHPILVDSATTEEDVRERILPALAERNLTQDTAADLLVTHTHGDHNGGTPTLLSTLPKLQKAALSHGESLHTVVAYAMGGHTLGSMGYYDRRTETLLSGDGLQFWGVGKYGCSIADADAYDATLDRIAALDPAAIIPSHDFIGGSAAAIGRENARALLQCARDCWQKIKEFVRTAAAEGKDVEETVADFREQNPSLPPLPRITVKSILAQKG